MIRMTVENNTQDSKIYVKIEELLGIDLQSLALFRIAISAILIIDLCIRSTSLFAHYTDAGVVTRSMVVDYGEQPWFLSFHMLSGEPMLQIILFFIAGLSAVSLLIGYKSRFACFLCWILTLSLHVRNPFVNNLGDWLLVALLFWAMFLPLGAKFSIDSLRQKITLPKTPTRIWSIATLAILLQVGFVYLFSVGHKIGPAWQTQGTAIQLTLNLDRIVSPLGKMLLELPEELLQFMTFSTIILERWGPLIAFVPFFTSQFRVATAFVFIVFHVALALFFELGLFPYICIVAWILFFPSWIWDRKIFKYWSDVTESLVKRIRSTIEKLFPVGWYTAKSIQPTNIETLIGVFILFCTVSSGLLYNGLMDELYYKKVYKYVEPLVNTLNLKQRWDMFSPEPPRNDGWFTVVAQDEEGKLLDCLNLTEKLTWSKPRNIAHTYKDQRWLKYMEWVADKKELFANQLGRYYESECQSNLKESQISSGDVWVYYLSERLERDFVVSNVNRQRIY